MIYLIIPRVLHTDIHTDIHTDPLMKLFLDELSLLKILPRENYYFHCCLLLTSNNINKYVHRQEILHSG